ncbi:MAG: cytochrome c3 family protein [Verrucomicrobiota bacterium]|nr:cytochrome c3 family protein [Verrucomicrobiota bacterium]
MTQYASTNAVQASWDNVVLSTETERYRLLRKEGMYYVEISPIEGGGENTEVEVGMLTGSHHMQVFWMSTGHGNLQVAFPFTWLIHEQRWVPRKDTFLRNPEVPHGRETWNNNCIRCHTTGGQPRPDRETQTWRSRVAEMGIACEACHGPGEKHVAHQRSASAKNSSGDGDSTIVQPAHLDARRSSEVCGNCHSIKWFEASDALLEHGFTFKPGDDLSATTPVIQATKLDQQPWLKPMLEKHPRLLEDFFWSDGMPRSSGREYNALIESPCYQGGRFSCLSCHSMHQSEPDDQLAKLRDSNQACLQCHKEVDQNIPAHTHHREHSSGSLCYNCHMPHTTYGLLKTIRSHQVSSPTVKESLETGRPNACNLCHLDKTLEWTANNLQKWYGTEQPNLDEENRTVAASLVWLMKGDAAQRALIASAMGRKEAQDTSGKEWMPPFLVMGMADDYSAVRFLSHQSLKTIDPFENLTFDYVGSVDEQGDAIEAVFNLWRQNYKPLTNRTELFFDSAGNLETNRVQQLLGKRSTNSVHLRE